jgi:teichuronic acid biosynthesis glycosyltransferase TuaC
MRLLIVCRERDVSPGPRLPKASFIAEQASALSSSGISVFFSFIPTGGLFGYVRGIVALRRQLRSQQFDVIHAHHGLGGLVARFQWRHPLVVTFHGSDIYQAKTRAISRFVARTADWRIFVSYRLASELPAVSRRKTSIIPCAVDLSLFKPTSTNTAREKLGLALNQRYVLFAGSFDRPEKNSRLGLAAVAMVPEAKLLELRGYSRADVALLLNAVDALLVTSSYEGSCQIAKEAMACNCPIVCTDVADLAELVSGIDGCYTVDRDAESVAQGVRLALSYNRRTQGRTGVRSLGTDIITKRLIELYMFLSPRSEPTSPGGRASMDRAGRTASGNPPLRHVTENQQLTQAIATFATKWEAP